MTSLADMFPDEIRALLLKGTACPRTHAFIADLYETYEAEEVPGILQHLARAADAMRDKPADFDMMDLSLLELHALLGSGGDLPDVPGFTDRYPGAYDMPLRELDKRVGPHEAGLHVRRLGEKLDAERAEIIAEVDRKLAESWRYPE